MSDRLTVLLAEPGKAATKTHTFGAGGWTTESYDSGWLFNVIESKALADVQDLQAALAALAGIDRSLVVRGRLLDEFAETTPDGRRRSREPVRRLLYERIDERGTVWPPAFADCDQRWLAIDIDNAPAATGRAPRDYDKAAAWVCANYLPDWLKGASCVYQWSASSGIKPWDTMSLHLWFLLDRPACSASLREWFGDHAEELPAIDRRLYNPVQVHYVADPIIRGAPDPIPKRLGIVSGERRATLPVEILDLLAWQSLTADREAARKRRMAALAKDADRRGVRASSTRIRYANAMRAGKCSDILESSKGSRHDTIVRAAHHLGGLIASGYLDRLETVEMLIDAGSAAYEEAARVKDIPRIVNDGIEIGEGKPINLDHVGASPEARERVAAEVPAATYSPNAAEKFNRRKAAIAAGQPIDLSNYLTVCSSCGASTPPAELTFDQPTMQWLCRCGAVPFATNDQRLIATGLADYGVDPTKWPPMMREAWSNQDA